MNHKEEELKLLKDEIIQMWRLVISQLEKARTAFFNNDVELALKIAQTEKSVNSLELKVERNCENYIALYNPVAIDLRLVLSIMKISISLERIGDYAEGIALHILDRDCNNIDMELIEELEIEKMFGVLLNMITNALVIFDLEETKSSRKILKKDKEVNRIYKKAFERLESHVIKNPKDALCGLKLILLIRKLERFGDHSGNIVEEIVFFLDAKVLKHKGKIE